MREDRRRDEGAAQVTAELPDAELGRLETWARERTSSADAVGADLAQIALRAAAELRALHARSSETIAVPLSDATGAIRESLRQTLRGQHLVLCDLDRLTRFDASILDLDERAFEDALHRLATEVARTLYGYSTKETTR